MFRPWRVMVGQYMTVSRISKVNLNATNHVKAEVNTNTPREEKSLADDRCCAQQDEVQSSSVVVAASAAGFPQLERGAELHEIFWLQGTHKMDTNTGLITSAGILRHGPNLPPQPRPNIRIHHALASMWIPPERGPGGGRDPPSKAVAASRWLAASESTFPN
ncbi:hypothetical protein C8R44DRAFT_726285 [Mycena epipterygia]|nr:hypothetical protein C8R44DRAFT_726285 [Mycena epipterygia]